MTTWQTPPRCKAGPKEKARFASERVANRALDRMWSRAIRHGTKGKMPCRAYHCKVCKGWHLTSQKSRETDEA